MSEQTPHKLSAGEKHMLRLIQRDAGADGWTRVSKVVAPFFTDKKIPCGIMPDALCEFEPAEDGGGRARLTQLGENLLEAMLWL